MAILMAVNRKKLKRGSESEVQKSSTLPQKGKDFPLVRQPSYAHEDRDPGPVAAFVIEFSSDVLYRLTMLAACGEPYPPPRADPYPAVSASPAPEPSEE